MKTEKTSKYKGVYLNKSRYKGKVYESWRACIRIKKHLGSFKTEEDAHQAYLKFIIDNRYQNTKKDA